MWKARMWFALCLCYLWQVQAFLPSGGAPPAAAKAPVLHGGRAPRGNLQMVMSVRAGRRVEPISARQSNVPIPASVVAGQEIMGKYVVAKSTRGVKSSGKSTIFDGRKTTADNAAVKIKVVGRAAAAAADRDVANTRAAQSKGGGPLGLFGANSQALFVGVLDYYPAYNSKGESIIIMPHGGKDLRSELHARGEPIRGAELRRIAADGAAILNAIHEAGLVWSDLSVTNLVLSDGSSGGKGKNKRKLRAIDLESAVPQGAYPVDYNPEAAPPEVAVAYVAGKPWSTAMQPSYDAWSLGMLLLHLYLGRTYYKGLGADGIMSAMARPNFEVDLAEAISDDDKELRKFLGRLLDVGNPARRVKALRSSSFVKRKLF